MFQTVAPQGACLGSARPVREPRRGVIGCVQPRCAPPACERRGTRVVATATFDEGSLQSLTSVNLGPSGAKTSPAPGQVPAEKTVSVNDVELKSDLGIDYSDLKACLAEGRFQDADDETRALLIKMAGEQAVKRGWVYFTEVRTIPAADLETVDNLWRVHSNGKFGYSAQREVWVQNRRQWPRFFKTINWVFSENNHYRKWPSEFTYSLDAKKGHLPLTNALRGTQLFQEILEHPAINKPKTGPSAGGSKLGSSDDDKPSWL